jgi:Secretion system C-terminal sorting domain
MKNFTFICVIYLLLSFTSINAQEVAPLQLGNIWIYNEYASTSRTTVVDTNAVIDTVSYCKLFRELNYSDLHYFLYMRLKEDGYYAFRRDTSYPAPNDEQIYYKKNAVLDNTWITPDPWSPFDAVYTIEDTFSTNVFGEPTTVKYLTIDSGLQFSEEYWTEKFGKLSRSDFGGLLESLQGCVIAGVVYGDTSFNVVSVDNELIQPESFTLQQNYPNPFNPSTSIQYTVSSRQFLTLKVYDILGREVVTLVNEEKPAGNYEVEFDGSGLGSGTYFYQLKTDNYIETKKMQLMK